MKTYQSVVGVVAASMLLGACAHQPLGPHVQVMPGQGKPFEVFQQDQSVCQAYANQQVGGEARDANNRAVGSAVLGTLLGAGLGAAAGGGQGAAIDGAGAGAIAGTAYGANGSQYEQGGIQRQYDIAYTQCMYSHGNQVPAYGGGPRAYGPPQGGGYGPPPGGGYGPPPPPPPGY